MTIRIEDADAALAPTLETPRNVTAAMSRGAMLNCPSCGDAPLFERYLKVADTCPGCHEALHHHRADDAPPYFTIFIVGHFIVGGVLAVEQAFHPVARRWEAHRRHRSVCSMSPSFALLLTSWDRGTAFGRLRNFSTSQPFR
jgi:uncharacterized protein (DUF983 family)